MNATLRNTRLPRVRARGRARAGLSMVEALLAMAITSMLLVAVSSAFHASSQAVQVNDEFFRASQTARVVMHQMLAEIRRADSIECYPDNTTYFDVMRPEEELTAGEGYRRYQYDPVTRRLTLTTFTVAKVPIKSYVLANNIDAATFGPPEMGEHSDLSQVPQRLPVTVSVKVGSNYISLNGAAGPRRALK